MKIGMANVGETDRTVRALVGILLIVSSTIMREQFGVLSFLGLFVGLEILATGIFAWSPMYAVFRLSSNPNFHDTMYREVGADSIAEGRKAA